MAGMMILSLLLYTATGVLHGTKLFRLGDKQANGIVEHEYLGLAESHQPTTSPYVYDMQGRPVPSPWQEGVSRNTARRGLYLVNGRKVLVE